MGADNEMVILADPLSPIGYAIPILISVEDAARPELPQIKQAGIAKAIAQLVRQAQIAGRFVKSITVSGFYDPRSQEYADQHVALAAYVKVTYGDPL